MSTVARYYVRAFGADRPMHTTRLCAGHVLEARRQRMTVRGSGLPVDKGDLCEWCRGEDRDIADHVRGLDSEVTS